MDEMNENNTICEISRNQKDNDNDCQKNEWVAVAFSMILFVSAIFGIWRASSIANSIAASVQ